MNNRIKGMMVAASVAALFAAAPAVAQGNEEAKVKCSGVNGCKGQGQCGTATHDCAGKNECKGKGWIKLTKAECEKRGGTVVQ